MSFFSNHLLQATNELMKKYWDPKVRVKSKISPMDRQKSHPRRGGGSPFVCGLLPRTAAKKLPRLVSQYGERRKVDSGEKKQVQIPTTYLDCLARPYPFGTQRRPTLTGRLLHRVIDCCEVPEACLVSDEDATAPQSTLQSSDWCEGHPTRQRMKLLSLVLQDMLLSPRY